MVYITEKQEEVILNFISNCISDGKWHSVLKIGELLRPLVPKRTMGSWKHDWDREKEERLRRKRKMSTLDEFIQIQLVELVWEIVTPVESGIRTWLRLMGWRDKIAAREEAAIRKAPVVSSPVLTGKSRHHFKLGQKNGSHSDLTSSISASFFERNF